MDRWRAAAAGRGEDFATYLRTAADARTERTVTGPELLSRGEIEELWDVVTDALARELINPRRQTSRLERLRRLAERTYDLSQAPL